MRRCTKCGLSVDEGAMFNKDKSGKNGLRSHCKECVSKYKKQYHQSEHGKAIIKKYKQSENWKKAKKKYQEYSQTEEYKTIKKEYYKSAKYKASDKKYRLSEKGRKAYRRYRMSAKRKETERKRYAKNKISNCVSSAIRASLKGNKNGHHWENLTGWTLQQFKRRFVQLFKPGMTWENHGAVWEIDHIVPLSVHNITSSECTDFKRAWALSNLQPLFREENQSKRDKLEKHFQTMLF